MKHLSIAVTTLCVLAFTLSGCFAPENPCHEFQVVEKNIYNSVWKVDTFAVYINDTINAYHKDTSYANDGTFEFIPANMYSCDKSGTIKFTRASGEVVWIDYSFRLEDDGNGNKDYKSIALSGNVLIDSVQREFQNGPNINLDVNKMVFGISWHCYWYHCYPITDYISSHHNNWRFRLSKK